MTFRSPPSHPVLTAQGLLLAALALAPWSLPGAEATPAPPKIKAIAKAKAKIQPPPIVMVPVNYDLVEAFPGLRFEQPLGIVSAPGDNDRLFIVEKTGRVQVITGLESGTMQKHLFLDLSQPQDGPLESGGECGLLGLAFPPDHGRSGRCFVYYSLKIQGKLHQRVSRFQVRAGHTQQIDPATEQPLFTQADDASNHNGGDLQFGPDGYLYISVGDGGSGNDKLDHGRFIDQGFHAGILRIDVDKKAANLPPNPHPSIARAADGSAYYAVPADNPFVAARRYHDRALAADSVRTEFWATGLRNPWRLSFDPVTQRLFTGDVGQGLYEEINIIVKGGDYGWSYREGLHPFPQGPGGTAEPGGFRPIDPIFEYPRTVGLSVTGGIVYHGEQHPALRGRYIFADYATGRVISLQEKGQPQWSDETLAQEPGIAGIGHDPRNGDVLFANMAFGQIKRLQPKTNKQTPPPTTTSR